MDFKFTQLGNGIPQGNKWTYIFEVKCKYTSFDVKITVDHNIENRDIIAKDIFIEILQDAAKSVSDNNNWK